MGTLRDRLRIVGLLGIVVALVLGVMLVAPGPARADPTSITWMRGLIGVAGSTAQQPSAVFTDSNGNVYVFTLVTAASGTSNVTLAKFSPNAQVGGPRLLFKSQVTTGAGVAGTVSAYERPSAAIDAQGNVYVAWVMDAAYTGGRGSDVYVSKSVDGGKTWLPPALASATNGYGSDSQPALAVAPSGTLWLAWLQYWAGWTNITVDSSSNGGTSFGGMQNITRPTSTGVAYYYPAMAVDLGGRVYVAYTLLESGALMDLSWSDGGGTWTTQTLGPTVTANTYGYLPSLLAEATGNLDSEWRDNTFAPWGGVTLWFRQSQDRGATWLPAVQLAGPDAPIESFGDWFGPSVVGYGENLMVVYSSYDGTYGGIGWAVSATDGATWYPAQIQTFGLNTFNFAATMDANGTVWLGLTEEVTPTFFQEALTWWSGPPSTPVITSVSPGTATLTVSWSAPPEKNVQAYQIWRSADGISYQVVATVSAPTTTYADTGLANGTYWYEVTAMNTWGTSSLDSAPVPGTVGPTTQALIDQLQSELNALQAQLNTASGDLSSIQTQLNTLQGQLNALRGTADANNATLDQMQTQLNNLQNEITAIQGAQATQSATGLLTVLVIVVLVVQVVSLVALFRRPKGPGRGPPPARDEPRGPPKPPEDEL